MTSHYVKKVLLNRYDNLESMGQFGNHYAGKYDTIITIGNANLRIIDGKLQIRSNKGTAILEEGFGISNGKKNIKLGAALTTNSTSWIDVTGLSLEKQQETKLKRILSSIENSKLILKKIAKNSPLELKWLDINFGIVKARFEPKKK